ncbi:FAD-binding protein, partial [uncultured Deefgea sp.]|uniref:FAD-binding protein n=1 Tax=uncultured Deefgea sp. TaxID=1304914 RepID=UPI002614721D
MRTFDVLILGSGLGGMTIALQLADQLKVGLITKRALRDGGSGWAQGGIAAVLDGSDSSELHINDTQVAGAGLCDLDATRFIIENSKEAIDWLIEMGVPFTKDDEGQTSYHGFHLTREGGHSHRRIIHAADATGAA